MNETVVEITKRIRLQCADELEEVRDHVPMFFGKTKPLVDNQDYVRIDSLIKKWRDE